MWSRSPRASSNRFTILSAMSVRSRSWSAVTFAFLKTASYGEGCTAVCKEIAPQERDLGHQRCRFVEKRVDLGGLCRNQNGFLRLFGQALQIYGAVSPLEQRGNVDYERHKMRVRIECKERAETFCYVDRRRMG